MSANNYRAAKWAASLVIAALIPVSFNLSLATMCFIPAIAAVEFLWFSRGYIFLSLALVGTVAATGMLFGTTQALLLVICFVAPALCLSYLHKRGTSTAVTLTIAMIVPVIALALQYTLLQQLIAFMSEQIRAIGSGSQFGGAYSAGDRELFLKYLEWTAKVITLLFPSILLLTLLATVFLGLILGDYLIRHRGIFTVGIRSFPLWKPAEALIIPLGAAGVFVLTEEPSLSMIGWNLLFLLFCLYTIFGLSFIEYQMRRRSFPAGMRVAVYLFLFLTQFVAAIVLPLIALFDSKFDFRRVRAKQIG